MTYTTHGAIMVAAPLQMLTVDDDTGVLRRFTLREWLQAIGGMKNHYALKRSNQVYHVDHLRYERDGDFDMQRDELGRWFLRLNLTALVCLAITHQGWVGSGTLQKVFAYREDAKAAHHDLMQLVRATEQAEAQRSVSYRG
ncbi:hypothetical protein [Novosphingobium aquimarinum]|uniref:hypothetical protein n=1 Tax=Novosphingobium aquimarinum TaxID=2682494 RepID=UPI0012ECB548|nr:hypothetical protein [Novosphingobium aquimarinum]